MTKKIKDSYKELEERFEERARLTHLSSLIEWDGRICAPEKASEGLGAQMAYLSMKRHEIITRPDWQEIFDDLKKRTDLNDWQQANVREAEREWIHETAVPGALVEKMAKASNAGENAWFKAKAENDFKSFAPHLQKLVALQREIAGAKAEKMGVTPYDALLDMYQPGMTSEKVDALFDDLKAFLPGFIKEVQEKQGVEPPAFRETFPIEKQKEFTAGIMKKMGFDFSRGRMDPASSAFCTTCGKDDIRIVGRFDETTPLRGVSAVMHETGHGLYEQGLPYEYMMQPVGQPRGNALHESQSLLMAGPVMQSPEFIRYLSGEMQKFYGSEGMDPDSLEKRMHHVTPSMIRINADEVTYPLHVILRYELERDMINGKLDAGDLPEAWNGKMKEYLGIEPANDREGCLQDIHWAGGNFGYFPDYTVGAVAAAQFFEAAKKQVPEIPGQLEKGDFSGLKTWLNENVHSKASKLPFDELIKQATGKELSADAFKNSLRQRYLGEKSKENQTIRPSVALAGRSVSGR